MVQRRKNKEVELQTETGLLPYNDETDSQKTDL